MKDIAKLSIDISNFGERVIENVKKAQSDTAYIIQQDAKFFAPVGDGETAGTYRNSIELGETTYDGNTIKTQIYTQAIVTSELGGEYNLGRLLEEGTSPHDIYPVNKPLLKWQNANGEWRSARYVHHPGTVAQPHFLPALNKNIALYKSNISKAIKEAK